MSDVSIINTSTEPTVTTPPTTIEVPPKRLRYQIEAGAMTQAPFWSNKKDRSNRQHPLRAIRCHPAASSEDSGGVAWSAEHFYMLDGQVGEPVEFGCNSKKNGYTQEIFRMSRGHRCHYPGAH